MNNNISVLIADDNEDLAKELSSYIGAKPNMTVTAIATVKRLTLLFLKPDPTL